MDKLLNLKFDSKTVKLMKNFNITSVITCFISLILLYIFNEFYISISLYKCSLILFRTGLLINISSIICGIFVTELKK